MMEETKLRLHLSESVSEEQSRKDGRSRRKFYCASVRMLEPMVLAHSVTRFVWQAYIGDEKNGEKLDWGKYNPEHVETTKLNGIIKPVDFKPIVLEENIRGANGIYLSNISSQQGWVVLFEEEYSDEQNLLNELINDFTAVVRINTSIKNSWKGIDIIQPEFLINYDELLNDVRWRSRRIQIIKRDYYRCQKCGITKYKTWSERILENGDTLICGVQDPNLPFRLIVANSKMTCELDFNRELDDLEVHHKYYNRDFETPWDYPDDALITLCRKCHKDVHHR